MSDPIVDRLRLLAKRGKEVVLTGRWVKLNDEGVVLFHLEVGGVEMALANREPGVLISEAEILLARQSAQDSRPPTQQR